MAPLNARQLKALRAAPANGGNRVAVAIALTRPRVLQVDMAKAMDLPQPYVSDVARSRYQTITVENAHKFADFFGCQIEDLFPAREAMSA